MINGKLQVSCGKQDASLVGVQKPATAWDYAVVLLTLVRSRVGITNNKLKSPLKVFEALVVNMQLCTISGLRYCGMFPPLDQHFLYTQRAGITFYNINTVKMSEIIIIIIIIMTIIIMDNYLYIKAFINICTNCSLLPKHPV